MLRKKLWGNKLSKPKYEKMMLPLLKQYNNKEE